MKKLLIQTGKALAERLLPLLTLTALVLLGAGLAFKFDAATAGIVVGAVLLLDIELLPVLAARRTR